MPPSETSRLLPLAQDSNSRDEENVERGKRSHRPTFLLVTCLCILSIFVGNLWGRPTRPVVEPPKDLAVDNIRLMEMWELWQSSLHKAKQAWNETPVAHAKPAEWADGVTKEVSKDWKQAEQKVNGTLATIGAPEMLNETKEWFRNAWESTSAEAHGVWTQMGEKESTWWDRTVHNEKEWFNHTLVHLRKFGSRIQTWWDRTLHRVGDEEQTIQGNFESWWQNATLEEKQWWNNTVAASLQFENNAENRSKAWWEGVEDNTVNFEHKSVERTKALWNRTVEDVEDVEHSAAGKISLWWKFTRAATSKEWEKLSDTERRWWNATQVWFHDHRKNANKGQEPLLYHNSSMAYVRLFSGYGWADHSSDYFLYQTGLDAQINQAYCAVASVAALLNSYRPSIMDALPHDPIYDPHPYATQDSLLKNECVNKHVITHNDTWDGVFHAPGGLSLEQTRKLLMCHLSNEINATVKAVHVDANESGIEDTVRRAASRAA